MTYQITANGIEMGTYDAVSADAAILAYVNDAGYTTVADAAEVCGQSVDEFLADITATETKGD